MLKPAFARTLALLTSAALLTACGGGGGGHSGASVLPVTGGAGSPVVAATSTFTFTIVKSPSVAASAVRPAYVSQATKSIAIQVTDTKNSGDNSDIFANVPAALKAVQFVNFANLAGNGSIPGQCGPDLSNAGNYKCTATFQLPVGINTVAISSYDANGATGNKLSGQIGTYTTIQGAANAYPVTLDANAFGITVSGTSACTNGPIGPSFGSVGTSAVTLSIGFTDAAGKTVVAPGLPLIKVQDNTATYQSASGTINGTGGTVGFSINQAAQTVTLTPSGSSITNATINVEGVPPNAGDGLSFAKTKSFAFSTGPAPPAGFLAVIEQLGAASGKLDLYTVSLGASDAFTPYTVSGGGTSLVVTNSLNESKPDIDNPRALLFDSSGNLLVANGGQGGTGGDYGDFACIPAGSISTGAAVSTTSSTNAKDPESIEIGTDTSVAVGNVPASATYNAVTYTLGTVYTAAPALRNIANPGTVGTFDVLALPTAPSGTFAAAITDGANISRVVIKSPGGGEQNVTDATMYNPHALGWDAANGQIVVAGIVDSNAGPNANKAHLDFFSLAGILQKAIVIRDDGAGNSLLEGDHLAVSQDGHVAVAGVGAAGLPEVQVYDNNAATRGAVGDIPFDACVDNACVTNVYGTNPVVTSVHFLSNTKLLVTLNDSSTPAKQGVYIYDISQLVAPCTCYDPFTLAQEPNSPKQTGFQQFATNPPLGAAYKP